MPEQPLYTGADRGHFRVMRLIDNSGVKQRANCRIKEVTVFNYLSDLQYAIVGYSIEWWLDGEQPPHNGGEGRPYIPRNRPQVTKLYFRCKMSIVAKMLYLEDAIINDFLNNKALEDSMKLLTYTQEATEQIASAATWRALLDSPWEYANAVHITKLEATTTTPLTVVQEGLRYDWRPADNQSLLYSAQLNNYPFSKLRDCFPAMKTQLEGIVNGG